MAGRLSIKKEQRCLWISRLATVVLSAVLTFAPVWSQTFTGVVKGEGAGLLMGANVVATVEGNKTVAYSITDDEGRYRLVIPEGSSSLQVHVSYLGFQTKRIPSSQLKDGMTITLAKSEFRLREVRVRPDQIRKAGDTLTYSVASFRHQQDRSIADVIAKMPGIEVKDDGRVEYQGKAINKFYIEGLDLMGTQYGAANKNLSADKVLSVQVIENHQPVKSLRGVTFSDQAALNIVLKDNAKAAWNGTADVGVGYGDELLYDCRLTGMRFSKKFQTLMMYKNNNTGKDIGKEVHELASLSRAVPNTEYGILRMPEAGGAYMDRERYTFNRSHLLAGNWLWRLGKDSELRIQGSGFMDKQDMQSQHQTVYLTLAGLPCLLEETELANTRSEWKGEANYQYNGARTFIRNNLKGYIDFNKSTGTSRVNGMATEMMTRPRRRSLANYFQMSHTAVSKNVYEVGSSTNYDYLPGMLLTLNGLTERLDLKFLATQNYVRQKTGFGKHYVNNQLGLDYHRQQIGVEIGESGGRQSHAYHLLQPYLTTSLSLNFGQLHLEAAAKISYSHQEYRQSRSDAVRVEPSVYTNWQLTPVSKLILNLRSDARPLMGKAIYDTPVFTGYQTRQVHLGQVDTQWTQTAVLTYQLSNPVSGLFFNIQPNYSRTTANLLYETSLDERIYTLKATDRKYTTASRGVSARLSKSFRAAKTVVSMSGSWTASDYSILVGSRVDDARMNMASVALEYSLRPVRQFSLEGKTTLLTSRQKNLSHQEMSAGGTSRWLHYLNLYFFPTAKWMVGVKNELFHDSEEAHPARYFCDLTVSYKVSRWELSLAANNLVGNSLYETRTLGNTVQLYSVTRLRPREILCKFSVDL